MVARLTIRIPEHLAAQLRHQSDRDGLSLSETAARAIERGLAEEETAATADAQDTSTNEVAEDATGDEWWRTLGDLLDRPPLKKFDPQEFERSRRGLNPGPGSIMDDLEWVRGDATES